MTVVAGSLRWRINASLCSFNSVSLSNPLQ